MNQYKDTSFLKLFLQFFVPFFILFVIISLVMTYFGQEGYEGLKKELFAEDKLTKFVGIKLGVSILYGLGMTIYYKFIKK